MPYAKASDPGSHRSPRRLQSPKGKKIHHDKRKNTKEYGEDRGPIPLLRRPQTEGQVVRNGYQLNKRVASSPLSLSLDRSVSSQCDVLIVCCCINCFELLLSNTCIVQSLSLCLTRVIIRSWLTLAVFIPPSLGSLST